MATTTSPPVGDKSGRDMANSSPASSGRSVSAQHPHVLHPPKQSLRGLNKPKCIKCGNIARARCPFQSCKGCCVKAENPCHIHVLKQQSILPDKASLPPPVSEPPSTANSYTGAAARLSSLRQLSNNFANSLRSKKPLSRKDAININKWRFATLREHVDREIETENEAFDRYIQNVRLLEETMSVDDKIVHDPMPTSEQLTEDGSGNTATAIKARSLSNTEATQNIRGNIQDIVERGLKRLQNPAFEEYANDHTSYSDDLCVHREPKTRKKIIELRTERMSAVTDLVNKLGKARCDDDIKSCLEIKLMLFNQDVKQAHHTDDPTSPIPAIPSFSLPKLCTNIETVPDIMTSSAGLIEL